jgi:hypothetical protein
MMSPAAGNRRDSVERRYSALAAENDRLNAILIVLLVRVAEIERRLEMDERLSSSSDWLPVKQFAHRAGLSAASIYLRIRQGRLAVKKVGGLLLVAPPSLQK